MSDWRPCARPPAACRGAVHWQNQTRRGDENSRQIRREPACLLLRYGPWRTHRTLRYIISGMRRYDGVELVGECRFRNGPNLKIRRERGVPLLMAVVEGEDVDVAVGLWLDAQGGADDAAHSPSSMMDGIPCCKEKRTPDDYEPDAAAQGWSQMATRRRVCLSRARRPTGGFCQKASYRRRN